MKRRNVLKSSAAAVIGLSALPGLSVLFKSCGVTSVSDYRPVALSMDQFHLVEVLAETLLPETDTPGASQAGVAPFIDILFRDFLSEAEIDFLTEGIDTFQGNCQDRHKRNFTQLSSQDQIAFTETQSQLDFFKEFKQLTTWAYFTSEMGMKSMNYQPAPGRYEGCITMDESTKNIVGN